MMVHDMIGKKGPLHPMSSILRYITNPKNARNLQDGIFACLVLGVTAALMLFLIGSADVMTSLTLIGMMLGLSLAGGVLRFFSMARMDADLQDAQITLDQSLRILQSRVGDHDLTLMQMAGQIDVLETNVNTIKKTQDLQARHHDRFARAVKDKMLQIMTAIARPTIKKAREEAKKSAVSKTAPPALATNKQRDPFFTPPLQTANDMFPTSSAKPHASTATDDMVISPSLIRDAIDNAIAQNRIDLYIQPIATVPQRRLFGYEVSGRIRLDAGVYIPASIYRGHAAHAGVQGTLDRLVLANLPSFVKSFKVPRLFVNICADAIKDPGTVSSITRAVLARPDLKGDFVLEFAQRDLARLDNDATAILTELARAGVVVGVNDVQNADLDLNMLSQLNVKFLKIPHDRLMFGSDSDAAQAILHRFITRLQTRNIKLIVGHVEGDREIRSMLDFPVSLAQGYAFGRPDRPVAYQARIKVA